MPLINRFRIVNFRYDDDKKYIANEIYEFDGKSALINLENGGGKSIILQLALQVVLPNTSMGSRNFSDYFKVGSSPAHVMIEWKLDGTRADYLLTGICISKNADGLRFFTYTHTYTLPHDLDIKGLEAANRDKQVVGFSEYHNYLKRLATEMRQNINIYSRDRQKEYRDKLHTFNLFREEFDAIKIINQSEGGIDKFFENARKSRNVIEKLIIPNIPQAEGETSGILAETFKKHLENLKNIPLYQHRIKTYEAFCLKASSLLDKLEGYGTTVADIESVSRDILALNNLINLAKDKLFNEVELLEASDREYIAKIEELKYKRESFDYQNKVLEFESKDKEHKQTVSELDQIKKKIEETDKKIRYMEAASLYEEVVNARNEMAMYKAQLESLSREKDEIDKEYQNCIFFARILLREEIERIEKIIKDLKNQYDSSLKVLEDSKKALKEKDKERDIIRDKISSIDTRLKDDKDMQSQITGYFVKDMTLLIDPVSGLQNLGKDREELLEKSNNLNREIEKADNLIEDININETRTREEVAAMNQQQQNKEAEVEDYAIRISRLHREISMYEISGDVYDKSTLDSLKAVRARVDNSLSELSGRYHELLKRKHLFDGSDYYVPDLELKKVYELLKNNGIRFIPGSLWLKNQREDFREDFLHKNPLLCHSIVLEKSELDKIRSGKDGNSVSEQILEIVESYPVTFIVDSEEGLSIPKEVESSCGIDRLGTMEAYMVFSKNNSFALDQRLFNDYLTGMDQNIARTEDEYKVIKNDQEKITGLIERCMEFVESYPKDWLKEMQGDIERLNKEIESKKDALNQLKQNRESLLIKISENRKSIQDIDDNISEKDVDMEKLSRYIEITDRIKLNEKLYREADTKRNEIEEEKKILKERIDAISNEVEGIKLGLDGHQRDCRDKNKTLEDISLRLNIDNPTQEITGTLEEILSKAKGLESRIGNSQAEQIRGFIERLRREEQNRLKEIRNKGFDQHDFETHITDDREDKLDEERRKHTSLVTEETQLSNLERKLLTGVEKLSGMIIQLKENIKKTYKQEPFEFESIESMEEASFNAQIDAYNRKRQKNKKKLEETEKRGRKLSEYGSKLEDYINENEITIPSQSRENMDSLVHKGETISMWDMLQLPVENLAVISNESRSRYRELKKRLEETEVTIRESYDELYNQADWAENVTIRMIIEKIINNDLYNYRYVKDLFKDIIDSVDSMKKAAQFQLEESLRDKTEIVERCYSKAEAVYEELKSVDTFSRIKIDGVSKKTVVIEMPQLHLEEGKALMTRYIEVSISDIEKMKAEGKYDPARIDGEIARIMSPVRLLDAVTNLNEYSIKVFKPDSFGASRYIPWEVVIKWSGGEKLAGFFAMFISIISYLRYKKTNFPGSKKVIWIDNPFGQANADYLLSYIFDLAKATDTQMICLTGHMQVDIYMQFDVVYSLIHRQLTGMNMSVIQSKLVKSQDGLESAFYKVKQEQMTLF